MPIDPLSVATQGFLQNPSALSTSYALTMASLGWLKTVGDIPLPPEPEEEPVRRRVGKGSGGYTAVNLPSKRKLEVDKREYYDLVIVASLSKVNGEQYYQDHVDKLVFKHKHDPDNEPKITVRGISADINKIKVQFNEMVVRHRETTVKLTGAKVKPIPVRTVVSSSNPENIDKKTILKVSAKPIKRK